MYRKAETAISGLSKMAYGTVNKANSAALIQCIVLEKDHLGDGFKYVKDDPDGNGDVSATA